MPISYQEIFSRTALTNSKISGVDYSLNPYRGCAHSCLYCYADFMGRFSGHKEPWGQFVDIKINLDQLLAKEIQQKKPGVVSLSTVTDPYQPIEERYRITRRALEILKDSNFSVSILTKSSLVQRDLDILCQMQDVEVGFSIPVLNSTSAELERRASSPQERFKAAEELKKAGVKVWIFIAPALPYFSDSEENLEAIFESAKKSNVDYILVDSFQAYPKPWGRMKNFLRERFPQLLPLYEDYKGRKDLFLAQLRERVEALGRKFHLEATCDF